MIWDSCNVPRGDTVPRLQSKVAEPWARAIPDTGSIEVRLWDRLGTHASQGVEASTDNAPWMWVLRADAGCIRPSKDHPDPLAAASFTTQLHSPFAWTTSPLPEHTPCTAMVSPVNEGANWKASASVDQATCVWEGLRSMSKRTLWSKVICPFQGCVSSSCSMPRRVTRGALMLACQSCSSL